MNWKLELVQSETCVSVRAKLFVGSNNFHNSVNYTENTFLFSKTQN